MIVSYASLVMVFGVGLLVGVFYLFLRFFEKPGSFGRVAIGTIAVTLIAVPVFLLFGRGDQGKVVTVADSEIAVVEIQGVPVALEVSGIDLEVGDEVRIEVSVFGEERWRITSFTRKVD